MADLRISGLHKYYGSMHAVKGIDLEIPSGEFTVLVGQSGCGKSTLLRTIAGLEEIDQGTVQISGQTVNDLAPKDRDKGRSCFKNAIDRSFARQVPSTALGRAASTCGDWSSHR